MPTYTDNRSNGLPLDKLTITSYPANALVMEMSVPNKKVGLEAQPFFQVRLLMTALSWSCATGVLW